MYNDEENLYHYSYQKENQPGTSGSSVDDQLNSFQYHSGPQQPVQEMKPVKKNRTGLKVTALALCCALLGAPWAAAWSTSPRTSPARPASMSPAAPPPTCPSTPWTARQP